jgi:hypothetical protein
MHLARGALRPWPEALLVPRPLSGIHSSISSILAAYSQGRSSIHTASPAVAEPPLCCRPPAMSQALTEDRLRPASAPTAPGGPHFGGTAAQKLIRHGRAPESLSARAAGRRTRRARRAPVRRAGPPRPRGPHHVRRALCCLSFSRAEEDAAADERMQAGALGGTWGAGPRRRAGRRGRRSDPRKRASPEGVRRGPKRAHVRPAQGARRRRLRARRNRRRLRAPRARFAPRLPPRAARVPSACTRPVYRRRVR